MVFVHSVDFQRFRRKTTSKRDVVRVSETRQKTTWTLRKPESLGVRLFLKDVKGFFHDVPLTWKNPSLEEQLLRPLEQKKQAD